MFQGGDNMKKRILAFVMCLLFLIPQTVYAIEGVDENGPVIHSAKLMNEKDSYTYEDSLNIQVDVTDDLTGVMKVGFSWAKENGGDYDTYYYEVSLDEPVLDGSIDAVIPLEKKMSSGTWNLVNISAVDAAENFNGDGFAPNPPISIYLDNSSYVFPTLNDITVLPQENVTTQTELTFNVFLTEGTSPIQNVNVAFVGPTGNGDYIDLEKTDNSGKYSKTLNFEGCMDKTRSIQYIAVTTEDGEYFEFSDEWEEAIPIGKDITITFEDVVEDLDAPELISIDFDEDKIQTPAVGTLRFYVKDATTAVVDVFLCYTDSATGYEHEVQMGMAPETGTLELTREWEFGRYSKPTTIEVTSIRLVDLAGNESVYSVSEGTLKELKLEVSNDKLADEMLYLHDEDLLDKLKNFTDGDIVLIDTTRKSVVPKEVFEIIKGKDITLVFERIYAYTQNGEDDATNGIQWIVNGRDVKNPKDIDVSIEIEYAFYKNPWVKMLEQKHENPLPVEYEWDEPAYMEGIIKQALKDAGYEDIIPEIEKNCRPDEYFSEAFVRMTSDIGYIQLVFADNGELPAKSAIRLKPAYSLREYLNDTDVYLYYLNPIKNLFEEKQSGIFCDAEGYFEFNIFHNSTYALSNGFEVISDNTDDDKEDVTDDNTTNDDSANTPADTPQDNLPNDSTGNGTGDESSIPDTSDTNDILMLLTVMSAALFVSVMIQRKRFYW